MPYRNTGPKPALTQRAYTLRLRGANPNDDSWRDALWATHEAVNKGAKAFGDWLLTLRGGLDHRLGSEDTKNRRVVLALGWLSVEDAAHAPKQFVVASGEDPRSIRDEKVLRAFKSILKKRGLDEKEVEAWVTTCEPSLRSNIKADAVWVDRSAAFDAAGDLPGLTRAHAQDVLEYFHGPIGAFLSLPRTDADNEISEPQNGELEKSFAQKASGWLSFNCGEGKKSDKATIARRLRLILQDLNRLEGRPGEALLEHALSVLGMKSCGDRAGKLDLLRKGVGWRPASPSKALRAIRDASQREILEATDLELLKQKLREEALTRDNEAAQSPVPWAAALRRHIENVVGFEYRKARFTVLLDHALRRFSSTHSWMKRVEAKRRTFDADVAKLDTLRATNPEACNWLDTFCNRRSQSTGVAADNQYRIRKRALGGRKALAWKAVLEAWSQEDCRTREDRIDAVRRVQSYWDDEEKFGHADLFEELASEEDVCVWKKNGRTSPQILIDYVAGCEAVTNRIRYKVPMYRHPDALKHPVFCDYGESRFAIHFQAQRSGRPQEGKKLLKHTDHRALTLQVLANGTVSTIPLMWACKRLEKDLAMKAPQRTENASPVSRADRLGRAACGSHDPVEVMNVYGRKHWNGRLQVPRHQLERLASLSRDPVRAESLRRRLHWFITFSPQLQPQGPWLDYARSRGLLSIRRGEVEISPRDSDKDAWRGLAYPVQHPANEKGRKGLAKHILSRLDGLRILSVDLGHRFSAACVVWETLTKKEFETQFQEAQAKQEDGWITFRSDLYAMVMGPEQPSHNGRSRRFRPTTVYRRIGPDVLPDGTPHPAPWARIDRQFFIKLQGEECPARYASHQEMKLVEGFAERYGLRLHDDDRRRCRVDKLMARIIRNAKLALRRHAQAAKIAWALSPNTSSIPTTGGGEIAFQAGDDNHVKLLTDTLLEWYRLATDSKWDDQEARRLWNREIASLPEGFPIQDAIDRNASCETPRQQHREAEDDLRAKLESLARALARKDRSELHRKWRTRWELEDGQPAGDFDRKTTIDRKNRRVSYTVPRTPATGWHAELRWLTDWIMGRRFPDTTSKCWPRRLGGLSLTRVSTIRALYQLHIAFSMRPTPDQPKGAPEKGDSNAGIAARLLKALERLREQRVKQLASRIAASALGLGGHWKPIEVPHHVPSGKPTKKTRWVWVEDTEPRYPACQAIVIESLTNYRPDERRTRRENRQLMSWSSAKVKKYLAEACQLNGLHLREVSPAYTSRQDSRTGAPGIRCADVPIDEFLSVPWWRKRVRQAYSKSEKERTPLDLHLVQLEQKWSQTAQSERKERCIRIPVRGGDLFVSAWEPPGVATNPLRAIHADLNAAANIGLRALMDPDWSGRWWYIPCNAKDGKPAKNKVAGVPPTVIPDAPLSPPASRDQRRSKKRRDEDIVNRWRDPSAGAICEGEDWRGTKDYWHDVEARVVQILARRQWTNCQEEVDNSVF